MNRTNATFLHRLTALLTLWAFVFTLVAPSHGALSQARERFIFTQTDAKNHTTSYTYDEVGNQLTQTDAKNHTTSYTYDNLGRRKTRKLPGNQVESLLYNEVGNLEFRTDFNGTVTKYGYDPLNRLKTRTVMSLAAGVVAANVSFTYTANGQRETMTDSSGVTTYHYDSRDRLDYKETPQGTLDYDYDEAGNVTHLASSNVDGMAVTYRYDDLGRLDEVEEGVGEITHYAYDEVGNLQSFATPNGVTHGYSYNALNRLTNLTAINAIGPIATYNYTQLRTGHRSAANESSPVAPPTGITRGVKYQYDALYRLRKETITANVGASGVADYALDAVGNRTGRTSTVAGLSQQTFTHDANDRLNSDAYDANGNTKIGKSTLNATGAETAASTVTDTYDTESRLVSRTGPNGTVTIIYDGDGNKVRETHNATTTAYLIDTQNLTGYAQVVEELVNGNVVRTYTYGHDLLNQDQKISSTTWQATWFSYDGHGSVRQLTDGIGNVTDRYDYDAFGVLLHSAGTTFNRYRYCGEQYDDALGLYYLRARFMNASNGRFWSMDSYEGNGADPASLHKYLYANADPVNGWDPSGRNTESRYIGMFKALAIRLGAATAYALALGNAAHRAIYRDYEDSYGTENVFTDRSVKAVLDLKTPAKGKTAMRPDIVNNNSSEVWEIKPGWSRVAGAMWAISDLNEYLDILNDGSRGDPDFGSRPYRAGTSYHPVAVNLWPYWIGYVMVDSWSPGVLLYTPDYVNSATLAYLTVSGFYQILNRGTGTGGGSGVPNNVIPFPQPIRPPLRDIAASISVMISPSLVR